MLTQKSRELNNYSENLSSFHRLVFERALVCIVAVPLVLSIIKQRRKEKEKRQRKPLITEEDEKVRLIWDHSPGCPHMRIVECRTPARHLCQQHVCSPPYFPALKPICNSPDISFQFVTPGGLVSEEDQPMYAAAELTSWGKLMKMRMSWAS